MRTRMAEVSPGVTAVGGSAEEIPLTDGSVDAVVAGQAYHWFDRDRAHPELARVLRPEGVFAAFWNDADLRTPWTVTYAEIIDGPVAANEPRPLSDFGPGFGPVEPGEFRHEISLTADDLVALVTTRSPYLVGDAAAREALLRAVRQLVDAAGLPDRGRFAMPHVTRVHRSRRR